MLAALRRGPASISRSLQPPSTCSRYSRSILSHKIYQSAPYPVSSSLIQCFSAQRQLGQRAAFAEPEGIENEYRDGTHTQQPSSYSQASEPVHQVPITRFKELEERKLVCPTVVRTLTRDMGLDTMTQVQSLTINETLKGVDTLAQAKTGTGKTLAFLIPVLQNIINYDPKLERRGYRQPRTSPEDIRAIIVSPTRELAEQIAVEAKKLTQNTGVIVQTAVGGTHKVAGLRAIKREGCHILVGTPGRLKDILSDKYSEVRAPNLSAFVLDEADRLLDQGFGPEIREIQDLLPNREEVDRQTLLYSATVPMEVMDVVRRTMKPNFQFVRTVQEGEQQTHEKVPQKVAILRGFENQMPALLELCKREIAGQSEMPFKAIVYFSATADVNLAASTFRNLKEPGSSMFHKHPLEPTSIVEMHARLTQEQRTKASAIFRNARSAILFSSDVTSRGMDFPNVTHVIQIGLPQTRDAYIHRLGRTARADKKGEGWLILTDLESKEGQQRLYNLPLYEDHSLQAAKMDMSQDAQIPQDLATTLTQVIEASRMVRTAQKSATYLAALGIYQWAPKGYLIDSLNSRAKYCWGMETPPSIPPGLASKLGYTRVPGANIGYDDGPQDDQRGRGRATGWLQADGEQPEGQGFSAGRFDRGGRGDRGGYDRRSSFGGSDRRSYGRSDSGMSSGNGYRGFNRGRQYGRGDRSASRY